jgi:3'-5' exoribonuclease
MMTKTIKQFTAGDTVQTFLLIKQVDSKVTSTNKRYMDLVLCDASGEIAAKLWDSTPEDEERLQTNQIAKVRASVKEWNNQPQLTIEKIRMATAEDGCNINDFVPSAPLDPQYMYKAVVAFAGRIQHKDIKAIVAHLLELYKDKLMYYPAAQKNHHAIRAGWLYHILTMLRSAEKMSEVYTFLNTDLLFAGVILHDMAKLEEMDANELGIVSDYTIEGQLLGHIIQGVKMVDRIGAELGADPEVLLVLEHMILSHHYKGEWGSPKSPMIPEAEVLHHLDIIDAHLFDMKAALANTEAGAMSDKIWTLSRKLYRTNL